MSNEGLLEGRWEKSERGPRKRMYSLGKKGLQEREKMLLEAIETVHAHYESYLMHLPLEYNVFDTIVAKVLEDIRLDCNLGFVTPGYSSIHHRLLSTINAICPEATVYLITPQQVDLDPKLRNIIQMDGFYNDIPLKEGYLDILTIIGIPPKNLVEKSLAEWKRSIVSGGKLAILTPTILIEQFQHPMPIGQFIENYEHTSTKRHEFPDKDTLDELIKANFSDMTQDKIVHITTIFAMNK